MEGLIKALTPDERIQIALFLSQQPVTRKPAGRPRSADGKQLFDKLCIGCHGQHGAGAQIPRLAGQQVQYVEDSLKRYRSGTGERIDPRMAAYTRNLKDADIQNLAAYLGVSPSHPPEGPLISRQVVHRVCGASSVRRSFRTAVRARPRLACAIAAPPPL